MKVSTTVGQLWLACSLVAASPLTNGPWKAQSRSLTARETKLPNRLPAVNHRVGGRKAEAAGVKNDQQSNNWSGAVISTPPSGDTFNTVSATFNVPQPSPPSGSGDGSWYGSAWVGIDGDTYQNALFQGGIQWEVDSSGGSNSYSYGAWIEWIPNASTPIDFTVNAGDSVTVTCTASSTTEGTCYYTNNSSGQSTTANASAPSSSAALGGQNVEWIVEDFEINSGLAPFANYGTETFTSVSAGTNGGQTVDLGSAQTITLVDNNGNTLSSCSIDSSSQLTCNYQ